MIIGFTGTRDGMTSEQIVQVLKLLRSWDTITDCVHGDCVGSDAVFDALCRGLGYGTCCYPGNIERYRAHTPSIALYDPVHPMKRNPKIVKKADVMVACPGEDTPRAHSGTWATIELTDEGYKPLYIVFPDGSVEARNT